MTDQTTSLDTLISLAGATIVRSELGAAHVREHCSHPWDARGDCDACESRWEAALAIDALRRGSHELLLAADRGLMSMIRLHRAALDQHADCVECGDIAVDALAAREELLEVIGRAMYNEDLLSKLRDEFGKGHVEALRDAEQRER